MNRNPFDLLRKFSRLIKKELDVYRIILEDERTPWFARILLGTAVGYLLLPFDLIPDVIPFLGQLDDLVLVPSLVWLALKLIPPEVTVQARATVRSGEA